MYSSMHRRPELLGIYEERRTSFEVSEEDPAGRLADRLPPRKLTAVLWNFGGNNAFNVAFWLIPVTGFCQAGNAPTLPSIRSWLPGSTSLVRHFTLFRATCSRKQRAFMGIYSGKHENKRETRGNHLKTSHFNFSQLLIDSFKLNVNINSDTHVKTVVSYKVLFKEVPKTLRM